MELQQAAGERGGKEIMINREITITRRKWSMYREPRETRTMYTYTYIHAHKLQVAIVDAQAKRLLKKAC